MGNSVLHKSNTRGHANHGWLNSYHSFSFANYYDADRMHFGALRVLNDDTVEAGMGFGTHPHDNMEIISIPLEGDLEHKDSTGTVAVIRKGDVQVMSAGTGITHSEYNRNKDKKVKFLQIWVIPDKRNVTPRYSQVTLNEEDRHNKLQTIVTPGEAEGVAWIHQQAWFYLGKFDAGKETTLALRRKGNGIYVFVLSGKVAVNGQPLETRDGYGLWNTDEIQIQTETEAEFLIMEVPMTV
jgi:redox-sensitive bicupin YhaK (pirin superfamily)